MAGKRRKFKKPSSSTPELNVMPFIDIFSMLNTFLLVSASFIGLGILEVQIPFLSNSPDVPDEKPKRSISIMVEVEKEKLLLKTSWSAPPEDAKTKTYEMNPEGIELFHQDLIQIKTDVPESEKVTMLTEDDVQYDQMILVLDSIKTLREKDPDLPQPPLEEGEERKRRGRFLYDKVVMGSVIL